jgi:phage terminase large subunit
LDALEVLSPAKRQEIEAWEFKDPNRWRVYGLGLLGKVEGLVYPNFAQVDELPDGDYFYGLDYGFANDPTVCVKNVIVGENLYSKELFYDDSALTNDQIARRMDLCKVERDRPIYPDPNEPKSAEELSQLGWRIGETVKGAGSVLFGIKKVNQYYQHWTKDSLNCIKEQRNYRYIEDKKHPGIFTDSTTHQWSHGMDSRRYAVASYIPVFHGREPAAVSNM